MSTSETSTQQAAKRRSQGMNGNLTVGRFGGVELRLNWSLLAVVALIVWSLSDGVFPSQNPGLSHNTYLGMAVVASLVFLAIEVRQAGREMLASTQQAQANAHAEYLLALASQPLLAEMLDRSVKTIPSMTAETAREGLFLSAVFTQFEASFHSAQSLKTRGAGGSRHIERALGRWASWPRVRDWWARDRDVFADDFQALVDEKIARAQAPERA